MKRILVIDNIISIGKSGASVSLPIFSSLGMESVLVPQSLSYSSFNNTFHEDLSNTFDNYINSFNEDMIHFDSTYCVIRESCNKERLKNLILKTSSNDTLVICNAIDGNESKEIISLSNIVFGKESLKEELTSKTQYLVSFNKLISKEKRAVCIYNNETKESEYIYYKKWDEEFSSLIDLFCSIVSAFYIKGFEINDSVRQAIKFITEVFNDKTDPLYNFYGLSYEKKLPELNK